MAPVRPAPMHGGEAIRPYLSPHVALTMRQVPARACICMPERPHLVVVAGSGCAVSEAP